MKKTISNGWHVTIMVFAILGMIVNVFLLQFYRGNIGGEYDNYKENLRIYRGSSDKFPIDHRLYHYRFCQLGIAICITAIVLYLLMCFIKKKAGIFTAGAAAFLIGTGAIAFFSATMDTRSDFFDVTVVCVGATAAMVMLLIGVWRKKAWPIWLAMLPMAASIYSCIKLDIYMGYSVFLGNYFAVLFLGALYVHGVNRANRVLPENVAAPATVYNQVPGYVPMGVPATPQIVPQAPAVPQVQVTPQVPVAPQVAVPSQMGYAPQFPYEPSVLGLFAYDYLIVDQKVRSFRMGNAYGIYADTENPVGMIVQENISAGAVATRLLLGKNTKSLQSFSFSIYDAENHRVGGLFRTGIGPINITDAYGNLVGTLKRGKLLDASENVIARVKSSGLSKVDVLDENDLVIATLHHKWNGLVKTVFTTADKYLITFVPGLTIPKKSMCLALCAGLDFITSD